MKREQYHNDHTNPDITHDISEISKYDVIKFQLFFFFFLKNLIYIQITIITTCLSHVWL